LSEGYFGGEEAGALLPGADKPAEVEGTIMGSDQQRGYVMTPEGSYRHELWDIRYDKAESRLLAHGVVKVS
jgi:hypothetical protein